MFAQQIIMPCRDLFFAKTMSEMEDFTVVLESAAALIPPTAEGGEPIYSSGYSTPMTPISVDFPSMTPTVTSLDATLTTSAPSDGSNKRQRTFSLMLDDHGQRSRACSFEVTTSGGEADFQQIWESLGGEPTPVLFGALLEPAPSTSTRKTKSGKKGEGKKQSPQSSKGRAAISSSSPRPQSGGASTGLPSRCSPEQRKAKVARYLEKRKRRVWRKEIKYSCRKQFAESRPRVAGRFIPKSSQQQQQQHAPDRTNDTA